MNELLSVTSLCKQYPAFSLSDVSFSVKEGEIMGLIGRNGAGKTTILKSLLRLVHPTSGEIRFFGNSFTTSEQEIKQKIGYVVGGAHYYQRKTVGAIVAITRTFYPNWDESVYRSLLAKFHLDESKRLCALSEGMKVKFHLTLALSHHAKLLILDEPTSGLDPVSRLELLDLFCELKAQGVAILFSTHIISDLERCADSITYLKQGKILDSTSLSDFYEKHREAAAAFSHKNAENLNNINLEDIMFYLEREEVS